MTPKETINYLKGESLVSALWWFIENMNADATLANEVFFYLRERVRRAAS